MKSQFEPGLNSPEPSATKSDDDGEGALGESFRCDSTKSKLILTDICKVCYRRHMYFKRHEIFEDVANKLITFLVSS